MRGTRTLASLGFLPLLLLGAACGKGGGGGSSPTVSDPTVPVIANLRFTLGGPCTIARTNTPGTEETLLVDYADADGNLRGGTMEVRGTAEVGGPITLQGAIPSAGVTISGTTSGTVAMGACLHFGSNASVTEEVRITDASGKASNVLTIGLPNPGGLPLLPRGAESPPRKEPRSVR
ncbi:MAG TPA: hypothetical protein VHO73_06150 [Methylomirabilota bacterium]|jgi:hypothetical protein|nr:hypothetical protein [Methylomirabilota bacterium]